MIKRFMTVVGAGAVAVAIAFHGAPVLAKCPKDCKTQIASEAGTCKAGCPKHKTGKDCRKACKDAKRTDTKACKHASNPTPPGCSPSGSFLD